jgi:TRAP-type mannitol/chloroaromatic compound transport system substrate-binding protein
MKPHAIYEPAKTIEALEGGALDATEFGQPWYDEGLRFHRVARHFYYPGWHARPPTCGSLRSISTDGTK